MLLLHRNSGRENKDGFSSYTGMFITGSAVERVYLEATVSEDCLVPKRAASSIADGSAIHIGSD
jgi:hypothetical protein